MLEMSGLLFSLGAGLRCGTDETLSSSLSRQGARFPVLIWCFWNCHGARCMMGAVVFAVHMT